MYTDHISPATTFLKAFSCLSNWRFSGQNKVDSQRTSLKHCIYVTCFNETHCERLGLCQSANEWSPFFNPWTEAILLSELLRVRAMLKCCRVHPLEVRKLSLSTLYPQGRKGSSSPGGTQLSLHPVPAREKRVHPLGVHKLSLHPVPVRGKRGCIPWGYVSSLSTLYPQGEKLLFLIFCFHSVFPVPTKELCESDES